MKHHLFKILFLLSLLFIPSCGVWQNFTTYFNLYYNTAEAFQQAEEAIFLQERSIFATEDIPVPASANQLLTRVIEKTSKILQFHSSSAFVDDALLMLGKSFYYQKNYLQALRKFRELTATQKESDFYLEAILWTGKTQMGLRDYDNGLLTLDSLRTLAAEEDEEDLIIQAFIEEVVYNIKRENYQTAIEISDELLTFSAEEEQQAEILFEIGKLYQKVNEPEKALQNFHRVQDYTTKYSVEKDALIEEGRTLRVLGRNEEALELFENMRLEDKYRDNFDVIDYEIGTTYMVLGRINEAVDNFIYIDTSYATSQYTGLARYNIGQIFENNILNFDSAATYYQKAASSQLPIEKVKEVHGRNQLFVKYGQINKRIKDAEKQLVYKDDPEAFNQDSIRYADSLKVLMAADSLESSTDTRSSQRLNTPLKQQITLFRQQGAPRLSPLSRDSLSAVLVRSRFDLANIFFAEMEKPDSAFVYYSDILNDSSALEFHSRTLYALGDYYFQKGDTTKADSIFNYVYNNFKTDRVANAAALRLNKPQLDITYDPAVEIFSEAERLWKKENYDTSLALYYSVYEKYPKSPLAPKALLAGGWILENDLKIPDSAAAIYDTLTTKFAGSPYALKIGPKIVTYKQEETKRLRALEDSLRTANQSQDSLNNTKQSIVAPDSLSEAEKLRMETEKARQDNTEVEIQPKDSLNIQEPKPDTLQTPNNQNRERRNPRRRG